jgi:galactokinase
LTRDDAELRSFETLYDASSDVRADAPGRVNLIGEHTDYHEGFVLPMTIPQRTRVQLRRRNDRRVRAWSAGISDGIAEYDIGAEARGRGWLDYVQGVTASLAAAGHVVSGFDARIESTVPLGSGLSSSAALEIALLRALRDAFGLALDDVEVARIGQRVETDFVGAPIGIMDQMASSLGRDGEALFLDTRSLAFERIPVPPAIELVVIDSGVKHQHAGGEYVTRRRESFEAARALGVERLRDVPLEALPRVDALQPILARRARHIITENARVLDAVRALRAGAAAELGRLLDASHASMRDDYEVSTPDIDLLVEMGRADPDIYGARLTGGGFGGATVMLSRAGTARDAAARIAGKYERQTGRHGAVLVP